MLSFNRRAAHRNEIPCCRRTSRMRCSRHVLVLLRSSGGTRGFRSPFDSFVLIVCTSLSAASGRPSKRREKRRGKEKALEMRRLCGRSLLEHVAWQLVTLLAGRLRTACVRDAPRTVPPRAGIAGSDTHRCAPRRSMKPDRHATRCDRTAHRAMGVKMRQTSPNACLEQRFPPFQASISQPLMPRTYERCNDATYPDAGFRDSAGPRGVRTFSGVRNRHPSGRIIYGGMLAGKEWHGEKRPAAGLAAALPEREPLVGFRRFLSACSERLYSGMVLGPTQQDTLGESRALARPLLAEGEVPQCRQEIGRGWLAVRGAAVGPEGRCRACALVERDPPIVGCQRRLGRAAKAAATGLQRP